MKCWGNFFYIKLKRNGMIFEMSSHFFANAKLDYITFFCFDFSVKLKYRNSVPKSVLPDLGNRQSQKSPNIYIFILIFADFTKFLTNFFWQHCPRGVFTIRTGWRMVQSTKTAETTTFCNMYFHFLVHSSRFKELLCKKKYMWIRLFWVVVLNL